MEGAARVSGRPSSLGICNESVPPARPTFGKIHDCPDVSERGLAIFCHAFGSAEAGRHFYEARPGARMPIRTFSVPRPDVRTRILTLQGGHPGVRTTTLTSHDANPHVWMRVEKLRVRIRACGSLSKNCGAASARADAWCVKCGQASARLGACRKNDPWFQHAGKRHCDTPGHLIRAGVEPEKYRWRPVRAGMPCRNTDPFQRTTPRDRI